MTYLALARQYRPKHFTSLIGQNHVVQALENALTQQRLHHAYLFTGTRGVGKTTISRILAKSLNCVGPDGKGAITARPCGQCSACTAIDNGNFADYIELDAASNRGVDEIQQLLEQAIYKPVQGRFKVFMIDEVHMMTNHAFNAMLKTLEEPPEYLKFVLATTDPQKVPVTVLSRCLQFNLRPISVDDIVECLIAILAKEQVVAEPTALHLLARAAKGSMRDALSLTDQAIAFGHGQIQLAQVRQMLGAVDDAYISQIILGLATGDGKTVVEIVNNLRLQGLSASATLEELIELTQQIAVQQLAPGVQTTNNVQQQVIDLAQQISPDENQLLYNLCLHGIKELSLAPDEYSALMMLLLRVLAFKKKTELTNNTTINASPINVSSSPLASANPNSSTDLTTTINADESTAQPQTVSEQNKQATIVADKANELAGGQDSSVIDEVPATAVLPLQTSKQVNDQIQQPISNAVKSKIIANQVEQTKSTTQEELTPNVANNAEKAIASSAAEDNNLTSLQNQDNNLADEWNKLIVSLIANEQLHGITKQLALNCLLSEKTLHCWTLLTKHVAYANNQKSIEDLTQVLATIGINVSLSVKLDKQELLDTPQFRMQQLKQQQTQQAKQLLLQDSYVRELVAAYDGKFIVESLQLKH